MSPTTIMLILLSAGAAMAAEDVAQKKVLTLDGAKQAAAYVSGPGGIWIISPAGQHLGTIEAPELPANFAWGDDDGRTLYKTARTGLHRMRLAVPGIRP